MTNSNARLETLADGVFAIAITLLILDLRLPETEISTSAGLWHALARLGPSVFAFVLSFGVILINWVNHHAVFRLLDKTSVVFEYANGFLLLAIVAIPFPTGLLGEYLWTDHAAPAVVVYDAVIAVAALGWIVVTRTSLSGRLVKDQHAVVIMRGNVRNGYVAFTLYTLLAILALWLPLTAAVVTALTWAFWLVLGIRLNLGSEGGK